MSQSATETVSFALPTPLPLSGDFQGGRLTSDGGWSWVAEADAALDLAKALNTSPKLWMNLQATWDLAHAVKRRHAA